MGGLENDAYIDRAIFIGQIVGHKVGYRKILTGLDNSRPAAEVDFSDAPINRVPVTESVFREYATAYSPPPLDLPEMVPPGSVASDPRQCAAMIMNRPIGAPPNFGVYNTSINYYGPLVEAEKEKLGKKKRSKKKISCFQEHP